MNLQLLTALLLFLPVGQGAPGQLEQAVSDYWQAIESGRYFDAAQLVHPDDRDLFVRRTHATVRSWKLLEVNRTSPEEGEVRIGLEQQIQNSGPFYSVKLIQSWVRLPDGPWTLRLQRLSRDTLKAAYGGKESATSTSQLPVLIVAPAVVKFSFLNRTSRGWFRISNGLQESAEVVGLEFDREKFELVEPLPPMVDARSAARVRLEYLGDEEEKDLTSELVLRLRQGGEEKIFELTLLYNHVDSATRSFFGLSDEDVRNLKRGDKLTPRVKLPPGVKAPGEKLPIR